MALLSIKASKKVETTVKLELSTAQLVDRYAHFLKVPADDVVESALEYIFTRDKEFQQHLAENPDAAVPSALRVKKPASSPNGTGNGRKTAATTIK
jgi:hypothetical protein